MARGRPREFDPETVLETALNAFWARGYQATSMNDLSAATGVAKPSLYAAFGDKDSLYSKALDQYLDRYGALAFEALNQAPDVRDALQAYLMRVARTVCDQDSPKGCLLINSTVESGNLCPSVGAKLQARRAENLQAIRRRLEKGRADGQLPADTNIDAMAKFFIGQTAALAVAARADADLDELACMVDMAIRVLPEPAPGEA